MWARYDEEIRATLARDGIYEEPSGYSDEPYRITLRLLEEARDHLLLRGPIALACPLRILQGMRDEAVPWRTALKLAEQIESEDVEVTLVKDGDHRLSTPSDLARLFQTVTRLAEQVAKA